MQKGDNGDAAGLLPRSRLSFSAGVAARLRDGSVPVVLIGGGGWLGQAALEMLDRALGDAMGARVHVFGSAERPIALRSGRTIACRRLDALVDLSVDAPLVLHCAFLTRDRVATMSLSDYVRQNGAITDHVMTAARRMRAFGVFLPSSGAVYRADRTLETDLERNPYGTLKVRDETGLRWLAAETGMRLSVARIFNLGGPFVNKLATYALSSIVLDLLADRPIVLKADHRVIRSYTHVRDVIDLALHELLEGEEPVPPPFDTAGDEEVEMGDLARRVAAVLGRPGWPVERPPLRETPISRYVGDPEEMRRRAGRAGLQPAGLAEQIRDTAGYLAGLRIGAPTP